ISLFVFFFQAEDGIRDFHVTGVQTLLFRSKAMFAVSKGFAIANAAIAMGVALSEAWKLPWPANLAAAGVAAANMATIMANIQSRSEERRVGKEGRTRLEPYR